MIVASASCFSVHSHVPDQSEIFSGIRGCMSDNTARNLLEATDNNNMNPKEANENELERTNANRCVPDIHLSAAERKRDLVRGMSVGMAKSDNDHLMPAAASGGTDRSHMPRSQMAQTDPQAAETEDERIFTSELNRMIDQYNAETKQKGGSMSCLHQKRPSSSLTVTRKRRKRSSVINKAVEIKKLLKAEEERDVYGRKWVERVRELMKYRNDNGHYKVRQKQSSLGRLTRDLEILTLEKHQA